jgi:hypothetical protein
MSHITSNNKPMHIDMTGGDTLYGSHINDNVSYTQMRFILYVLLISLFYVVIYRLLSIIFRICRIIMEIIKK